jgi:hypothetical protein
MRKEHIPLRPFHEVLAERAEIAVLENKHPNWRGKRFRTYYQADVFRRYLSDYNVRTWIYPFCDSDTDFGYLVSIDDTRLAAALRAIDAWAEYIKDNKLEEPLDALKRKLDINPIDSLSDYKKKKIANTDEL